MISILQHFIQTLLTLKPKTKNPSCSSDWRPIYLYNTTYKILSQFLSMRLKNILPKLLEPNQGAFTQGRGPFVMLL